MEEWRVVPGWEGFYEVSDQGRVRSLDRWLVNSRGRRYFYPGIMLTCGLGVRGYPRVALSRPRVSPKHVEVHKILMLAFVGEPPLGLEVRHKNGVRSDCRLTNLEYGTRAENFADSVAHGTARFHDHQRNKTHCPQSHLLISPNLCNRKHRKCLSCMRADARIFKAIRAGRAVPDKQTLSDQIYVSLGFELAA